VTRTAPADAPPGGTVARRLSAVVARLTLVNVVIAAGGLVTGPLLARALGAQGRGDLAAVLVPLTLTPYILGLGLSAYANRELPRGRPLRDVLGSLGVPLLAIGALAAASAVPIADALAGDRHAVRALLIVTFLAMPLLVPANLLYVSLTSLERWRDVVLSKALPFAVPFTAVVALSCTGGLTVTTAGAFTILGAITGLVPGFVVAARAGRPRFRLPVARSGIAFGAKSWTGSLALIANARLDQLLMITAVSPRELGLYAVATTIAGTATLGTQALNPPLMTRIAAGESHLAPHAVRVTLAGTALLNLALALASPILLPLLFGADFRAAVGMTIVLLGAGVPFAATSVVSSALQADGAPSIPSIAEAIAIVITVAGLAALLGPFGGMGAAVVSCGAYSASFIFQLAMLSRRARLGLRHYLVPSRDDLRWARGLVRRPARTVRPTRAPA
jgi:O-antigen/teichoic acid export membrane protein